jgi:ABC-type bacteriocin/lantibiotic exporter with double-glycine peptidase domain
LKKDIEILPSSDQTEIGEKGINLNDGQKARISLARAVYADKETFLMDDPLSAQDADVKKKIFKQVLMRKLSQKTKVLVTHAVDFIHLADSIICMKDG